MEPRKFNIFVAFFPYGGNGGVSSEHPSIRNWLATTLLVASKDPRISHFDWEDFVDTPITMTRNRAVQVAKDKGADILVMIDSDQYVDMYLGIDRTATPFFATAFDFIYERYEKGPHVVAAPYCGPPPQENVYMFQWGNQESLTPDAQFECKQFTREEAALRTGMEPVACAPTGVIMYDMRAFDLLDHPYFDYEWVGDDPKCKHCGQYKPGPRAEKASTEDVVNTRDLALIGHMKLGYNPLHCAWNCWAGHYKPKCVGKPVPTTIDQVNERYVSAVKRGNRQGEKVIVVGDKPLTTGTIKSNGHAKQPMNGEAIRALAIEETRHQKELAAAFVRSRWDSPEFRKAFQRVTSDEKCSTVTEAAEKALAIEAATSDDWREQKERVVARLQAEQEPSSTTIEYDEKEVAEVRKIAKTLMQSQGLSAMSAIDRAWDLFEKNKPEAPPPESLIDLELTENDAPQDNAPRFIGMGSHTSDNVRRMVIRQAYLDERTLGPAEEVGLMDSEEFMQAAASEPDYCWGRKLN